MSEAEFRAALSIGEDHLLWRAVLQSIEVQRQEAFEEAADANKQLKAPLLNYYLGAAAHLGELADWLKEQREKALNAELGTRNAE